MLIMMTVGFYAYMPFEAFHTAKKRQAGLPVEEFSSVIAPNRYMSRAPVGPVLAHRARRVVSPRHAACH